MITNVSSVVLYVGDQASWIISNPSTSIVLSAAAAFDKNPGDGAFLTFASQNVSATVDQLRRRGAVVSDPIIAPWGTFATVDAPDGHRLQFNERTND